MSARKADENTSEKIEKLEREIKLLGEKLEMQRSEFTARIERVEAWIMECPPQKSKLFELMCEFRELKEAFIMQSNILLLLMRRTFSLMKGQAGAAPLHPREKQEQVPAPTRK